MGEFVFDAIENVSYQKRNHRSQTINVLISLAIFALIFSVSNWEYALAAAMLFFVIQFLKANRWDKYFIIHIELKNDQVMIRYKEKNQEKLLTGNKNEFTVKKGTAFNRTETVYSAIYKNGSLQIKQFEIGEWKEGVFDKIILAFN